MSDLFQEIMNDVRSDRIGDAWNKHGRWLIYAAVSIVIVTAALVYWNQHKRTVAMRQTALYFEATELLAKGEAASAIQSLDKISVPEKSTYYGLVLLKKSQAQTMLGKDDEAKKLLTTLAARNDLYGDVGKVMLKDGTKEDSKKATALQFTRLEWAAWDLAGKGENEKAAQQFAELGKMEAVPATMRERAGMMANYLKNTTGNTVHE